LAELEQAAPNRDREAQVNTEIQISAPGWHLLDEAVPSLSDGIDSVKTISGTPTVDQKLNR
jgi:hypothetical protein